MSNEGVFEIAGGSVPGRSHLRAGRPNQDAWAWRSRGDRLVAVVADGCGSGAHSEVGARLGARLVVERLWHQLESGASLEKESTWEAARRATLATLATLAESLGGSLAETVSELFLFTVVGVAIDGAVGRVFAAGDGLFALDDAITVLGPFPGNEPPYLGYGLLNADRAPRLTVERAFDASRVRSILLGTDGAAELHALADRPLPGGDGLVGPLSQFWRDDRPFKNRDAVRRRLALVNREVSRPVWHERRIDKDPGLLEDDTTLVVIRRKPD